MNSKVESPGSDQYLPFYHLGIHAPNYTLPSEPQVLCMQVDSLGTWYHKLYLP